MLTVRSFAVCALAATLQCAGQAWANDQQLLLDDRRILDEPRATQPTTGFYTDHAFDQGSGIATPELNPTQLDHLVLLGKVWGFLKYHHPVLTSGGRQWDFEMLRVLPALLAAPDRSAAADVLLSWIETLGRLPRCAPCASVLDGVVQLAAPLEWLGDTKLLTPALSARLHVIARTRPALDQQFYVALEKGAGNPIFEHEPAYPAMPRSDAGFRLLSVYRFWNIIAYWYPNRDVLGEDWDAVLRASIHDTLLAPDDDAYQLALTALVAQVHDTHAFLYGGKSVRPPMGNCALPVNLRFIEGRLLVVSEAKTETPEVTTLRVGDELLVLDHQAVKELVGQRTPYYAGSNQATLLRNIARAATIGPCEDANLLVRRGRDQLALKAARVSLKDLKLERAHDRPGAAFQLLSPKVAYLKLSSVKEADLVGYIKAASNTQGLVVDLRNYPSDFVVFTLGSMLVERSTPFARFTTADLGHPGVFHWGEPLALEPTQPHYAGKLVILVDEVTQSQAEYTAMALRAAPGATVVGSTTAGADGNVSTIPLPSGLNARISGIGVFYPNRQPTQRVGIQPDIVASPSAWGLLAGRDEVLEAGLRAILGEGAPEQVIEAMAKR